MRAVSGRVFLMLLLLAAAAMLWSVGQARRRLADGHRQLATLQYAAPGEAYPDIEQSLRYIGRVPAAGEAMRSDAREQRAASQYWLSQYGALKPERDSSGALAEHDPQVLFLAANAAYRTIPSPGPDREETIRALEEVMKSYVDVLRNSPGHVDAAYNYELVVRKRNLLAQPKPAPPKPDAPASIHGRPGAPPKDSDFSQFKIVVPKREEERDDPKAGDRQQRTRKG
jgi:hypothetical protein